MFKMKRERSIVEVKAEHNSLVLEKVEQLSSGVLTPEDLSIPVAKYYQPSRPASRGPDDHNILAEVILSNTPAIDIEEKNFKFLRSMLNAGNITERQEKYLLDLHDRFINESPELVAAS